MRRSYSLFEDLQALHAGRTRLTITSLLADLRKAAAKVAGPWGCRLPPDADVRGVRRTRAPGDYRVWRPGGSNGHRKK